VIDFEDWLDEMATQPLPGGVTAAAMAAALGAALVAKTGRVTLQQLPAGAQESPAIRATVEAAETARTRFLELAGSDVRAYRAWLESRRLPVGDPMRERALVQTIEVPARVAETCQALLEASMLLVAACYSAVRTDLEVGRWLLETGRRAGSLAADANRKAEGRA
jgi:formiminotetrahydrofolate cyclodeaminase